MTDPSGLRVIEALCPSVSRYAMEMQSGRRVALGVEYWPPFARMGFDAPSVQVGELTEEEQSRMIADHIGESLKRAISEMRNYEPAEYCDLTGWHSTVPRSTTR